MNWELRIAERVPRRLARIPADDRGRLLAAFDIYPENRLVDVVEIARRTSTTY